MKRFVVFISALLCMLCFFAVPAGAEETAVTPGQIYLEDNAGLYNESDYALVKYKLQNAAAETGWCYGIYTTKEFDFDPEKYGEDEAYTMAGRKAEEIYDSVFGEDSSGVLFFCDVGYRYTVIANDARKYIVGRRFDNLNDAMKDKYFDYDDMGVVSVFVDKTVDYYHRGPGSTDITAITIIIPFVISAIIAAIAAAVVSWDYKTLEKPDTKRYLVNDQTSIYRHSDRVVNTRHYSYSNSSSSGSGHSGGGGFSGGHHGGGGFGGHR